METKDEKVLKEPFAEIGTKMHLLLHTGQMLMENGADSDRTVRNMMRTAAYMGIPKDRIHQHVMYTTLMLNVNDEQHSYTEFRKCTTHGINMTTLTAISKLTWRALEKNYSLHEFERHLLHIKNKPRNYPVWLTAVCAFLGFYVRRLCASYAFNTYAVIAITSFATTMFAWATQFLTGSMNWYPLISCTLFLVPGIPLINAVDDFLNNFIVSGMTRAIHTLLIVGAMTFGIVIAIRLGNIADFTAVSLLPDNIYFSQAIAAAISAMGFSIIFNIPRRLLPVVAVGGIITVLLRNIMVLQLGFSQTAGSFLGAAVVGVLALKAIHWFHAPNIILTIPSAIPMIPGVLLYRVLFALLNIQDITASALLTMMRNGVEAVTIIIGIAIGVAIPNIFIHRYIENNKQRTVKDLLDKRYIQED